MEHFAVTLTTDAHLQENLKATRAWPWSENGTKCSCQGFRLFLPYLSLLGGCGSPLWFRDEDLPNWNSLEMVSGDLTWSEVAERAESIHELNAADSDAALKRVKALLIFMEKKIKRKAPIPTC
ncbi:hypothetical protein OS493_010867 [Desmophyllum pertusum]|uniref:Uncharacterized protein n=1 Tax=Desmophyllum pertusum TaxID=174260 RepID=A0A9X0CYG1_9CNID|nr:hypothetical protein OS493_010867 [Desmophyllum pertusum]